MEDQPERESDMSMGMPKDTTARDFERAAEATRQRRIAEWESVHKVVPWGAVPDRNFEKFVKERWSADWTNHLSPAAFLDLGCGAGANSIWLAQEGYNVVAVDASRTACYRLLERISRHTENYLLSTRTVLVNKDLTALSEGDFPGTMFDCALDACCLQHLAEEDAIAVVQRTRKWLRPGGWFWSKQAIAPFDFSLNRVGFIRLATMESIRRTFRGYRVEMDMLREVVRGDKDLWSVIIRAQVTV